MPGRSATVLFIQAFGNRDLFTAVPPETMWGWQRNVGILVALLKRRGISWRERYSQQLSEIDEDAGLFFLRDWRYSAEEIFQLRQKFPHTPMISMLFKGPRFFEQAQQIGEKRALFSIRSAMETGLKTYEKGLFLADRVIVRSKLNVTLLTQLGYPEEKMVLLPHAPVWTLNGDEIAPARLPCPQYGRVRQHPHEFNLLFIGEQFLKKGLFRLYRAFSLLAIPQKRLHIFNRILYQSAQGAALELPDYMRGTIRQMINDPSLCIHPPYQNLQGLVEAQAQMDLMICPSVLDCGPNVLIEAQQLGTAVLSSQLCGAVYDLAAGSIPLVAAP
ncbi:MAG: glycosyltransferase family 4 protein, partial [Chloroflexi bacterium]|nr:glycosyltransferase family 4 protein [Chloroflexota bacterium]